MARTTTPAPRRAGNTTSRRAKLSPAKRAAMTGVMLIQLERIRLARPEAHAELIDYLGDLVREARSKKK